MPHVSRHDARESPLASSRTALVKFLIHNRDTGHALEPTSRCLNIHTRELPLLERIPKRINISLSITLDGVFFRKRKPEGSLSKPMRGTGCHSKGRQFNLHHLEIFDEQLKLQLQGTFLIGLARLTSARNRSVESFPISISVPRHCILPTTCGAMKVKRKLLCPHSRQCNQMTNHTNASGLLTCGFREMPITAPLT